VPFFTRYEDKGQAFETGEKPAPMGKAAPSQRAWKSFLGKQARKNPIRIADRFAEQATDPATRSYSQLAEVFGVSAAMVCYHLALLHRLPAEFVDWLRSSDDPLILGHFTERRLRPITRIEDQTRQLAVLQEWREAAEGAVSFPPR
jgi:hypothetical protein